MVIHATKVTTITLLGVYAKKYPIDHGNCFSVEADDGKDYKIVNFVYENLIYALEKKFITFPIRIKVLAGHTAVFDDPRIPFDWMKSEYCQTCCPQALLLPHQLAEIERQKERGQRIDNGNWITFNSNKAPDWRTERQKKAAEKRMSKWKFTISPWTLMCIGGLSWWSNSTNKENRKWMGQKVDPEKCPIIADDDPFWNDMEESSKKLFGNFDENKNFKKVKVKDLL